MKKVFVPLLLLLLPIVPLSAQYGFNEFAALFGLQGTWKIDKKSGTVYEVWQKLNDSTMTALSYRVSNVDTLRLESVVLSLRNGNIYYTPTTFHQNNQKPIDFTLIQIVDGRYDFENRKHDFPQLISYQLKSTDSLIANISGPTPAGEKKIPYHYVRVQ